MPENLSQLITNGFYALFIAILGYFAALFLGRAVQRAATRFFSVAWASLFANLVRLGILLLAIKFIVDLTGIVGAFVVIATALTGAFAIGSERLAADLVAGVKLVFLDYYKPGDMVTVAENFGEVIEITLTNTILETLSRDRVFIPNSTAIEGIVINHTKSPGYLVDVRIPIPGEHNRTQVMQVMKETASGFENRDPDVDPQVLLDDFGIDTNYYQVIISIPEECYEISTVARLRFALAEALNAQKIPVGEAE